MLRSTPQFPALDVWQRMDEGEQDALIARIETVQRRQAYGMRFLVGFGCLAAMAGVGWLLYTTLA